MIETIFNKRELFEMPSFEEDWATINSTFELLAKGFKIYRLSDQEKLVLEQRLKSFSLLQNYIAVSFVDAVVLEKENIRFNLVLLSINSEVSIKNRYHIRKENLIEYEFIGMATLNKSYGHVLIRPETIGDKITELFQKSEIDFDEEKIFSKRYFLTASDPKLIEDQFPRGILHSIGQHIGIHSEIVNNEIIIQLKKKLSQESTLKIATLIGNILEKQ